MSQAVIGLGFGDEGKGLVTDLLSSQASVKHTNYEARNKVVVRYSGGQQAGHTVTIGDERHVFSNFGAGTLRNIPTYWSKYCTVDPIGILNELEHLEEYPHVPILYIDPDAPVTTPWDKFYNQNSKEYLDNGTTGCGVGPTFQREEDFYHLKFRDLFNKTVLDLKIDQISDYYSGAGNVKDFRLACERIIEKSNIKPRQLDSFEGSHFIFEGSQGLLLDQHYGFFPHVTRANTGTKNILEMGHYPDLYLVTRAYQTRHGNGPMTNTDKEFEIKEDPNETNTKNLYQGEFRRSMLDLDLLVHGIRSDQHIAHETMKGNTTLVVTCLDHLESYKFTIEGEVHEYRKKEHFLEAIKNMLGAGSVLYSESPESRNIQSL